MRDGGWIVVVLCLAAFPPASGAETPVSTALSQVQTPRAQALGGAIAALERDPTLVWFSPSAAAGFASPNIALAGRRGLFGELGGQGMFSAPLLGGVASVGAMYFDAGSAAITTSDGMERIMYLQRDALGVLSFGIGGAAFSPDFERVSAGLSVKGLRSDQFGWQANAVAVDLGGQFRVEEAITVGAMVQNLGPGIKYSQVRFMLPTAARIGAAIGASGLGRDQVTLLADVECSLADRRYLVSGGAEYAWRDAVALRAGACFGPRWLVVTAGMGVNVGGYRMDYAAQFGGYGEIPHSIGISHVFGRPRAGTPAGRR